MTKYLFLYWNPPPAGHQPSPEEMQQMMAQWSGWKEKFKDQVLDVGDGLGHTGRVIKEGAVTDGPHTEVKEIVGGYSIVQAPSYEAAIEVARECPIKFVPGAVIEIREMMGY